MNVSIGTDIIEISRIRKNHKQFGQKFLDKIFTKEEQTYCLSKKNPYYAFASRFAAKEAFSKACHCGINKNLSWLDISVKSNLNGSPELVLSTNAQKIMSSLNFKHSSVSLSDTDLIANAVVILFS